MTDPAQHPPADHAFAEQEHHHVTSVAMLLTVFAALMFFTALTYAATYVDLGELNIYIALGIAAVKASIVALYFMHLRYDRPFNGLILVTAFLFVALFVGAVMDDTHAYRDNLGEPGPIRSQGP